MDKILKLGLAISLLFLSFLIKAQEKGKETYFLVENLSSSSYSSWFDSLEDVDKPLVSFACVPAKIVGVKEDFVEKFKATTKQMNFQIKKLEIKKEEAELKCAKQRKL
jgi:hypothetical protein